MTWVLDRAVDAFRCDCDECPRQYECRILDTMNINLLCEQVSERDYMLAMLGGVLLDVVDGREWLIRGSGEK